MKLIAIGDNVTDCYMDEGVYFPGGNAVNVAVNCKKNGAEKVNYIGVFGDDERADYIKQCLTEEGVTYDRSRKVYAHTMITIQVMIVTMVTAEMVSLPSASFKFGRLIIEVN